MKKIFKIVLLILIVPFVSHSENKKDSLNIHRPNRQSVGLVLSGGGAKGIAHAGVIKALEENDIPIDYVTGTSMGSIVGSLYCCGWSPEKMIKFFTAPDFKYWSTGTINRDNLYYISQPEATPQWVGVNISLKDTTGMPVGLPSSLISPLPMNIEFLKLYAPYSLQCKENFNNLFVPFRCVTSDIYHKRKIVLGDGSLGKAVRASMSFPLVFRPIKIDGVLVYDGGIYDNFPVNVMEEDFNPDFIIGVSVSGPDSKPEEGNIYSQLEDMIIQNNDYEVPSSKGVKIQVPVLNFGVLDFGEAETIYNIGYKTGLAMVDSIKKRVHSRVPLSEVTARRELFSSQTPKVEFDSVEVRGAGGGQARYLEYLFQGRKKKSIDLEETQTAYYRAISDGTLSNLVPFAIFGRDGKNILQLNATVKRPWSVGVGGWVTSSTNSMLYLDLGYHTLSYNSLDIELSGWIGQSYFAGMLSGKFKIRSGVPSYIQIQGVAQKQKYYDSEQLFYETTQPTFLTEVQEFLRVNYVWASSREAEGYAGLTWGYLSDSFYDCGVYDYARALKSKSQYRMANIRAGFRGGLVNDRLYPSEGKEWHADILGSYEESRFIHAGESSEGVKYHGRYRASVEGFWKQFFPITKHISFGACAQALATLQHLDQNYTATLVHAPEFGPTPATKNYFNEAFRSDNFVAAGFLPIWSPVNRLQIRGDFYVYAPIRNLRPTSATTCSWDGWFRKAEFLGEMAVVYNFPFASISVYGNYLSYPSKNWNFGINFGLYFQAPKIMR